MKMEHHVCNNCDHWKEDEMTEMTETGKCQLRDVRKNKHRWCLDWKGEGTK